MMIDRPTVIDDPGDPPIRTFSVLGLFWDCSTKVTISREGPNLESHAIFSTELSFFLYPTLIFS